jgi:hypothetical protein
MSAASKISRLAIGDMNVRPSNQMYTASRTLVQKDRMGEDFSFGSRGGMSVRHHFPLDGEYAVKVDIESPRIGHPRDNFQRSDADERLYVRVDGERLEMFEIGLPQKTRVWDVTKNAFADGEAEGDEDFEDWRSARTFEARFPVKAGTHTVTIEFLKRTLAYEGVRPEHIPVFYDFNGLLKNEEPGVIEFQIAGPYDVTGIGVDSPSRQKIFTSYPTGPGDETEVATEILSKLARQAYRRPVTDGDMDTLLAFYTQGRSETVSSLRLNASSSALSSFFGSKLNRRALRPERPLN